MILNKLKWVLFEDCDFECTAKKHYNDLHKYVMKLWEVIKEKYRTFDKDQALEQIKVWMADVVKVWGDLTNE